MQYTLSQLITLFLDWTAANRAPGTVAGYRRHLDAFAVHVSGVELPDLKAHHLLTWGTTWHRIQAVQRLFSWAKNDAELIERNPFARVIKPRPGGRRRILTYKELATLLRKVRGDFRMLLIASRETLCRPQEVRALNWEDLHHDETSRSLDQALESGHAFFRLTEFKSQSRRRDHLATRIIPISRRLGRAIARKKRNTISHLGPVFVTFRGAKWCKEKIRNRMRSARRRAGLVADGRGEQVCLYTLRHTMATIASAKGVSDRVLADLLGHSTTRTTARYQHLQLGHLIAAMRRIHERRK
jgi:integrase